MKAVKKKISIFLMTLMLASTFSANVTKADVIESKNTFAYEEIMPYAAVCPRCGGRITSSTVWGSWISSGSQMVRQRTLTPSFSRFESLWYSYMYSWSRMGN